MEATHKPDWLEPVRESLLYSLKLKDPATYFHCLRVARLGRWMGELLGYDPYQISLIEHSCLFHDIGKVGIPDSILLKPDKLTDAEMKIMESHAQYGADMLSHLSHIPFFRSLLPGIRHHHERIDGQGYPDGLKGENIPLTARIILVVDTFDSMTSDRSYREALSEEVAYAELERFAGSQFDRELVQLFVQEHRRLNDTEEQERMEKAA